jgi:glycosyltransferase involved in cell wall biosynthesis
MTIALGFVVLYWLIRIAVTRWRIRADRYTARPDKWPGPLADPPTVSCCVPARDEAAVIGPCVRAILAQDLPVTELILVDDRSSDGTAELARQAAGDDPRLRVVLGDGPPPGWMGKSAALWRAQQEASSDWLLFVDADVVLHPRALTAALAAAREHGAHMVSWLGQLETRSFWEHVLMPFIGDVIALFSNKARVNDPTRDDCLANGQFILIARSAYDAIGGHESIADSVIDDVSMSRQVKFHEPVGSLRYVLLHSEGLMRVRMYDSLAAIWTGFAKNFYAATKQQGSLLAFLVFWMWMTSIAPLVGAVLGAATGDWPLAIAGGLGVAAMLAYRVQIQPLLASPLWSALLQPLAALVVTGIVTDSWLRGIGVRKPVKWKGRAV